MKQSFWYWRSGRALPAGAKDGQVMWHIFAFNRMFHSSSWNHLLKNSIIPLHIAGAMNTVFLLQYYIFSSLSMPLRSSQCSFSYIELFVYRNFKTRTEGQRSLVSVGLSGLYAYKKTSARRDTWNFHIKLLKYNLWLQENHPGHIFLLSGLAIPFCTNKLHLSQLVKDPGFKGFVEWTLGMISSQNKSMQGDSKFLYKLLSPENQTKIHKGSNWREGENPILLLGLLLNYIIKYAWTLWI